MAVRRHVLDAVGGWAPFPRGEERELTVRLFQMAIAACTVPDVVVEQYLDGRRASRGRVRAWNAVEGRMRAGCQFEELFDGSGQIRPAPTPARRLAGVPLYLYRRLLTEALPWVVAIAKGRPPVAFEPDSRSPISRATSGNEPACRGRPRLVCHPGISR